MYRGFAVSVRGFSHAEDGRPCQDASGVLLTRGYAALAVADGHGGAKYARSDVGSRLAVDAALEVLSEFLRTYGRALSAFTQKEAASVQRHLAGRVIARWRERIERHFAANPPDEAESVRLAGREFQPYFYGTTLLYGAMTADRRLLSQIGDGRCVSLDAAGRPDFPVPEDERLGFGRTTTLCDERAIDDFRHCFLPASRRGALFLATDGVADSYTPESLGRFAARLARGHAADSRNTRLRLRAWLPSLSERGSCDDVSVACVHDLPRPDRSGGRRFLRTWRT